MLKRSGLSLAAGLGLLATLSGLVAFADEHQASTSPSGVSESPDRQTDGVEVKDADLDNGEVSEGQRGEEDPQEADFAEGETQKGQLDVGNAEEGSADEREVDQGHRDDADAPEGQANDREVEQGKLDAGASGDVATTATPPPD